jgi:hypothetical protein
MLAPYYGFAWRRNFGIVDVHHDTVASLAQASVALSDSIHTPEDIEHSG